MNIRETTESFEDKNLSEFAKKSSQTLGRRYREEKCSIRTEYQRDRDRIIHCKAFRRLKHKTQVFLSPEGDHYRTRLTHTLEVAQISRTISRALRLNEDLTEAIALGHDLGHTPFGHCGEIELNKIHYNGFRHNEQSLRVVDYLENHGSKIGGLNLTFEVRDGILNHNGNTLPATLEGQIVKISDRIAYINHDIDDAIRAKVLSEKILPKDCIEVLGKSHRDRINNMIIDIINNSFDKNQITMSNTVASSTNKLRDFMFEKVYLNQDAKKQEGKAQIIISQLYDFFCENPEKLPDQNTKEILEERELKDKVKDYIAGMSDRYAINKFKDIYIPTFWV